MSITRRRLVAAASACAAVAVARFPAGAAEFSLRLANELPADNLLNVYLGRAADRIAQESGGRVEVRLFPSSQLGGQTQMLSQLRLGALDFLSSGDGVIGSIVTAAEIPAIPFAYTGIPSAVSALDGPLGKYIRSAIAKIGLYPFEKVFPLGVKQILNSVRPINAPDDFKGLRIRIPDDPVEVALFKAFGASGTTSVPANEMYVSLQTHLVEGIDVPPGSIESFKLYEVQKYLSYTNHLYLGQTLLANAVSWQKLPKEMRDVIERNFLLAADTYRPDLLRFDASLETTLKTRGLVINHPTTSLATFRDVVRRSGLYAHLRETHGPEAWGLLERSVGKLT